VIFPVVVVLTHLFGMVGASLAWLLYSAATYVLLVPRLTRACLDSPALALFKLTARLLPSCRIRRRLGLPAGVRPDGLW